MPINDRGDVVVRVEVAAPPEVVRRFFTDPERVAQWLGQGAEFECRPGGRVRIASPSGDVALGEVKAESTDRIVFSWGYENSANGIAPGQTTVDIELAPSPKGTTVILRHSGLGQDDRRRGHMMGWTHYLGSLARAASSSALGPLALSAVDSYLQAWGETDPGRRGEILASVWTDDGVFKDNMGYAAGRDALDTYIGGAQRFMPGVTMRRVGELARAHGHILFDWEIIAPNGAAVGTGSNVGELAGDGRFVSMVGFWDG